MSNIVSLTLEIDDEGTVKLKDFQKKAEQAMDGVEKKSKQTGETGRLAFFALGESAENAAQSIGVPNQVARQLGNTVEGLAGRMGRLAIGLGVVGLAAMAGVAIYQKLREEKKRLMEQDIAAGMTAKGTIDGLIAEESFSKKLRDEIRSLNAEKKKMADEDLERAIEAQRLKIIEMSKDVKDQTGLLNSLKALMRSFAGENYEKVIADDVARANNAMRAQALILRELMITRQKSKEGRTKDDFKDLTYDQPLGPDKSMYQAALGREQEFQQARIENLSATGASMSIVYEAELASFDWVTQQKLSAATNEAEQMDILAIRSMQRATMVAEQEKQTYQMRWQAAQQLTFNLASGFQMLYQLGGKHARKYFTMYKVMSIAEATISGTKATLDAFAFGNKLGGPVVGGVMAAAAGLVALAKIATIKKQEFDAGGGGGDFSGGGGSVGTYPASSNTGLPISQAPTGQPQTPANVTNVYVQGDVLDMDQFSRKLLPSIKKAEADNVKV